MSAQPPSKLIWKPSDLTGLLSFFIPQRWGGRRKEGRRRVGREPWGHPASQGRGRRPEDRTGKRDLSVAVPLVSDGYAIDGLTLFCVF